MLRRAGVALVALALAACAPLPRGNEVAGASADSGRYHFQSNAWVNLHQRLLYDARFSGAEPEGLTTTEHKAWRYSVHAYGAHFGVKSVFDDELVAIEAALSRDHGDAAPASIPAEVATALNAAMPIYRERQWPADDRANREWIAHAKSLLEMDGAGEELALAASKAYGVPFPMTIRVDASAFAWEFGAYTTGEGANADAVISPRDPANQGYRTLEALVHEPSHAIVGENSNEAIGSELARASKELGVRPPANLWHAILFYTAGELTRRTLAKRGVNDYRKFIEEMYGGPFRGLRGPLETHWQAYLDGKVTREAAIRAIVKETAPARRP